MDALVLGTRLACEVAGDDKVAITRTTDTVFDGWVQFEM